MFDIEEAFPIPNQNHTHTILTTYIHTLFNEPFYLNINYFDIYYNVL